MQRKDVERLINTVHESKAGRDVRIRTIEGLRALLDRAEKAEAERDAAFAAGQEEMQGRAAKAADENTFGGGAVASAIRALLIKDRP